jgi:hypothetical protein
VQSANAGAAISSSEALVINKRPDIFLSLPGFSPLDPSGSQVWIGLTRRVTRLISARSYKGEVAVVRLAPS